ncbi:MAG: hypothetical protein HKN06_05095, partial [Gammaproteobacteria bacterium]|nr:hypothetical protein [Gammaproteobacteria bacterium]
QLADFLPNMLAGSSAYTAIVTMPEKAATMPVSVEVLSQLQGMAVTLPAPAGKAATTPVDFNLRLFLPRSGIQSDLFYPGVGNARFNWVRDAGDKWMLERGGINLGVEPAVLPQDGGLSITGAAGTLELDKWLQVDFGPGDDSRDPLLRSVRLRAQTARAWGEQVADVTLALDRNEREWLVQVDSATVSGGVFVPLDDAAPIVANMERLYIGAAEEEPSDGSDGGANPADMPEIDLRADDFRLGDMKLGEVTAKIRSDAGGVVMQDFASKAPSFTVSGAGAWRRDADGHRTRLDLKLVSNNVAPTLVDLGFDESIQAESAEIDFALNWPGPPGPQFKQQLDGNVKVRIGPGQLQSVQPGAGRVFGLLSVTALPRRLSLDFRDVFDKGFGFDYIEGDFTLDDGDAFTSNLVLEGPAAQVGIAGRAGLVTRDYDQTAVVYGNFGAALPVAGVIAGGPVVGGAMLIFSEIFKKPLQDMARINYRITGSWDEPEIERVLATADDGAGAS